MTWGRSVAVVDILVSRGEEIVLLQEDRPDDSGLSWGLPGGQVEPGELLDHAVRRELHEETGLELVRINELISVTQQRRTEHDTSTLYVFFFAVEARGELSPHDPDGLVVKAEYVARSAACDLIRASNRGAGTIEPIVSYLETGRKSLLIWQIGDTAFRAEVPIAPTPALG